MTWNRVPFRRNTEAHDMAREQKDEKWCPACFNDGCGKCIPPRQHLPNRCAWCGVVAGAEFCSVACAASSFEAGPLWMQFSTDAALQDIAERETNTFMWRFAEADRDF